MTPHRPRFWLVACVVLFMLGCAGSASARARFDTQVLALMPPPGYPALAYVDPNGRIYEGTYDNPTGDTLPSRVLEYTADGYLQRSWTIRGETLSQAHGVQVATSDAHGDLVLLELSPARAVLLDPRTGAQKLYATFPDLPLCPLVGTATQPCSPARQDLPPMPDYAAWGPDGSLYVTDYQQAVIWRVPPHGGRPSVWLADPRLDGNRFGTAGIELAADRRTLLFTQASSAGVGGASLPAGPLGLSGLLGLPPLPVPVVPPLPVAVPAAGPSLGALNPVTGKLYAVSIEAGDRPGTIRQLWESEPAEAPDGLAIARSGNVYIALAGVTNQLVEVSRSGAEIARFPSTPGTGDNGSSVPFDAPSSVMFLGSRLIVANQAYVSGQTSHMAILDVEVGEPGQVPYIPAGAGPIAAGSGRRPTPARRARARTTGTGTRWRGSRGSGR